MGERIGRYKLLQKVGEGGCGVVYMAEQSEPVKRRVALKVIKLGMDTKCVIARFEAERQALALMDHPNIAKVLDTGTSGDERGADFGPQECCSPNMPLELRELSPASKPPRDKSNAPFPAGRPCFVMERMRGISINNDCQQNRLSTRDRLDLFLKVSRPFNTRTRRIIDHDIKPAKVLVTLHDGLASHRSRPGVAPRLSQPAP